MPTFNTYADRFLARVAARRRSANTVSAYEVSLRAWRRAFGPERLATLTRLGVRRTLEAMLLAGDHPSTVRHRFAVLHALCADAVEDEVLATNPVHGAARRLDLATDYAPQALTPEALARVLAAAAGGSDTVYRAAMLLAHCALRPSEALGLRPSDLHFVEGRPRLAVERQRRKGRVILKTKSRLTRTLDVADDVAAVLRTAEGPWIVPLSSTSLVRAVARLGRDAELPHRLTPHHFRHTWASIQLAHGESLELVSRYLGHASPAFTAKLYGRWLRPEWGPCVERFAQRVRPSLSPLTGRTASSKGS